MLKAGFVEAQRTNRKQQIPQGNRTPVKNRSPITRSPIKTRRDCSPISRSPLRSRPSKNAPTYNPPYVKINYINNNKSPIKQRTPMKQLKDKYTTNTDQAYKFRDHTKYSPLIVMRTETSQQQQYPLLRKNSNKEDRENKLNHYQLFSKLAKEHRIEPKYVEESDSNYTEAEKRYHPMLNKIEDVKFIAVNFNSDPHLNKLNRYKENAPPIHCFNEMKKPVEKLLKRHLSDKQAEKPIVKDSIANFDRVLMSFDCPNDQRPNIDNDLNMDPFL